MSSLQLLKLINEKRNPSGIERSEFGVDVIFPELELADVAANWPIDGVALQQDLLDPLCRKIAVARRVWSSYDKNWGKVRGVSELASDQWPLMIGVLLVCADGKEAKKAGIGIGNRLKNLNGALQAIELKSSAAKLLFLPELNKCAASIIDQIEG